MLLNTTRKRREMKRKIISALAVGLLSSTLYAKGLESLYQAGFNEKIFVVEREDSSLAIIEKGLTTNHIEGMKNMNHAVVKFFENDGYVITRDGYVIKFDPINEKIIKEYKTSESAIGFEINTNYIAVANYDKKSVDILDRDLNPLQSFDTGSRNVGIKIYKDYIVFSQMDSDSITVLKDLNGGKGKPNFVVYKEFKDVGIMPFDALIKQNFFVTGFFKSPYFGVVDLDKMEYKKVDVFLDDRKPVYKVPHFGFWSVSDGNIFIPAVGDNKVFAYTDDFKFVKSIETEGLPVFTALSPDQKYMAVTFSGEKFPVLQIIDTQKMEVIHRFEFDGKVLHVRWSDSRPNLYVSVNDSNRVAVIDTNKWYISRDIFNIKKPSGIFIFKEAK